jgi:hypothetical protein
MRRNTVAINNVLKKNITKLNFQSAQYKKKLTNIILKNKKRKKKKYVEKHRSNSQYFKGKKLQSEIFNQLNI